MPGPTHPANAIHCHLAVMGAIGVVALRREWRHGINCGASGAMTGVDGASATLQVMADHVDRYHEQIGVLLPSFQGDEHGDAAIALVEAERALRTAARLLRRAAKATS
ncbi:MAG: hypothetical protein RJB61_2116 [Actinomycetota bacterium]